MNEIAFSSLIINTISALLCVFSGLHAYRKNNLTALIYWGVFIFLVVGQAIHISIGLLDNNEVQYLNNIINREGHLIASASVLYIILMVILLNAVSPTTVIAHLTASNSKNCKLKLTNKYSTIYYIVNWILFFVLFALLITLVGGVDVWLSSGRPGAPGATFFIIGLGLVMYPLLIKLASKFPVNLNDKLLFTMATIVVLSFSRILAVFYVLLLLFVYIYSGALKEKKILLKKYKWTIIGMGFLIFILVFGFGSYRHITPIIGTTSPSAVFDYIVKNPEASLFSLDLNYRISVEGMTGLSGVLSELLVNEKLRADFGLSGWLGGLIQLIPSYFRKYLGDFPNYVHSFYYYKNSIVGGGLEGFFVHFSFFGLLIYPFIFFWFAYGIHKKLINSAGSTSHINRKLLRLVILAVFGLLIIRGSTVVLIAFMVSELIIMNISIVFFKLFH